MAAGHPLTAEAGARVLREGGNAVDAAVGAMLTSFVAEPLLTGLGAGGYMLVAGGGSGARRCSTSSCRRPPTGCRRRRRLGRAELRAIDVSFGDAAQVFHIGPASCGVYGAPAGVCEAVRRWGTLPLRGAGGAGRAARPGGRRAERRAGLRGEDPRPTCSPPRPSAPRCGRRRGASCAEGELLRNPELGDALLRLGEEGAEPFYRGDVAAAVCELAVGRRRLAEPRGPGRLPRDRARAREDGLSRSRGPHQPAALGGRDAARICAGAAGSRPAAADAAGRRRGDGGGPVRAHSGVPRGTAQEGFLERFLATRLGATTHISVLDADGRACSCTCTNGEGSGVVVPGTGIHLNNVMGEEDLNPLGFHRHPAGRRMPSMMAPSIVMRDGEVELVLGSAGSNRIRSALLQTIVGVVDHGRAGARGGGCSARALRERRPLSPSRGSTCAGLAWTTCRWCGSVR